MKPRAPSVSILICVWNGQEFIAQAINSALQQDYPNFEVVVVDDGSNDATPEILGIYAEKGVEVITLPTNKGIPYATNVGLDHCRGKYVARLDADDLCLPHRLQHQVGILEGDPRIGALGGSALAITEHRAMLPALRVESNNDMECELLRGNQLKHSTVTIRRQVLTDHNLRYSLAFPNAHDYELWWRMSRVSLIANDSEPVVFYRYHSNQQTAQHFARQLSLAITVQKQALSEAREQRICKSSRVLIGYLYLFKHQLLLFSVRVRDRFNASPRARFTEAAE